MTLPVSKAQVEKGMALFDQKKPDWLKDIDENKLNIGDPNACALTQIYGSFSGGLQELGISGRGHEFGFNLPRGENTHGAYDMLNQFWNDGIKERRALAAV